MNILLPTEILEQVSDGVVILNKDLLIEYSNTNFLEIFKINKNAIVGKNINEILPIRGTIIWQQYLEKKDHQSEKIKINFSGLSGEFDIRIIEFDSSPNHTNYVLFLSQNRVEELQYIAALPEIANTSTSHEEFLARAQTRMIRSFNYAQLATWLLTPEKQLTLSGFQSNYNTSKDALDAWFEKNKRHLDECLQADMLKTISDEVFNYVLIPHRKRNSMFGISMLKKNKPEIIDEHEIRLVQIYGNQYAVVFENAKLQEGSTVDGLTKLFNAKFFHNRLTSELLIAEQTESPLSLLLFDIDHFKKFNDTYGHSTGDQVLAQVAQVVKKVCRSSDIVCRYGGEEFAIILIDTDTDGAKVVAEKIRKAVESHTPDQTRPEIKVTISVGVATFPNHASNKDTLINHSDEALYKAKNAGRNCFKTFSE